jgi:hypothetical protein
VEESIFLVGTSMNIHMFSSSWNETADLLCLIADSFQLYLEVDLNTQLSNCLLIGKASKKLRKILLLLALKK